MTYEEIVTASEKYVFDRQNARHKAKSDEEATIRDFDKTLRQWDSYDLVQAFEVGARFIQSRKWVSMEERLPENGEYVLIHTPQCILPAYCEVAYWDNEDWYTQDGDLVRPDYWMPIPPLDLKKEER